MMKYKVEFCQGREELYALVDIINAQGAQIVSVTSEQFQYVTTYTVIYGVQEKRKKA